MGHLAAWSDGVALCQQKRAKVKMPMAEKTLVRTFSTACTSLSGHLSDRMNQKWAVAVGMKFLLDGIGRAIEAGMMLVSY
jgi:hypothetical protein